MRTVASQACSHLKRILHCPCHRTLSQGPQTCHWKQRKSCENQRHISTSCSLAVNSRAQVQGGDAQQSRGSNKREAAKILEVALKLVNLTSRQLPRVERVLPESVNDAVLIAQRISKTTQARKRQVNQIAKLLRQLDTDSVQQIQAVLLPGHKSPEEQRRDHLAEEWMEGLLAEDKVVLAKINGLPKDWFDGQLVRRLARQYQQPIKEGEEGFSSDAVSDPQLQLKKKLRRELQVLAAQLVEHEVQEPYEGSEDKAELAIGESSW